MEPRRDALSGVFKQEHGRACPCIGQPAHFAPVLQPERVEDAQAVFVCQHFKILVRAHADIGRVVPLVGQAARDGHAPLQDGQPVGPVRKVGKGHHAGAPHTGSFAQHDLGVAQVLQRVDL